MNAAGTMTASTSYHRLICLTSAAWQLNLGLTQHGVP